MFQQLTDEQIRNAEQELAAQKREREHAKWDAELVGRYFRIIRTPQRLYSWQPEFAPFQRDDYVTLERSLSVNFKSQHVFADVVFIHIKRRDDNQLTCSGFEASHANRKEPYLKIQPVFYSYDDFRRYLGSWQHHTGPTKHVDEISKEEYETALRDTVSNFTKPITETSQTPHTDPLGR